MHAPANLWIGFLSLAKFGISGCTVFKFFAIVESFMIYGKVLTIDAPEPFFNFSLLA